MHPISRRVLTVACFVLAVTSVLGASALSVAAAYQNRVLPRTYVGGVSLGNKTVGQASSVIDATAQTINQTPLTVTLDTQTAQLSPSDLGIVTDTDQTKTNLGAGHSLWDWGRGSFWRDLFRTKHVALGFSIDETALKTGIEQKLAPTKIATDAAINIGTDGKLAVTPSEDGRSIDLDAAKAEITRYLTDGSNPTIQLNFEPTKPQISTEEANRVKTDIEQTVQPVVMQSDNQKFTFTTTDLYGLIAYAKDGATLKWQLDNAKLTELINARIAKKLNVVMVSKVVQSDNNAVLTEGRDGKTVDTTGLTKTILAALQSKTDTASSPLPITLKTLAFTTKTTNPYYTLNSFTGLYLDVSLTHQKLTIINTDSVIAQYSISSGGWKTPTPTGTLYIFNKISEAYSPDFRLWMPDWNGLATSPDGGGYVGYGIHGLVCWDKACTNREGVNHIGEPVSHGCIRVEDAGIGFIYEQVPTGTPVNIHI